MTTATATASMPATLLDEGAQALIDSRLDTIERMLLGQVPRADRLAIVREVEAQIHDLLAARNPDDTDRDAVLAALGRLDPPEAYLPDEVGTRMVPAATIPRAITSGSVYRSQGAADPVRPALPFGKASGIMGLVSVVLLIPTSTALWLAFSEHGNTSFIVFSGLCVAILLLATLAIIFAALSRLRSGWGVVGLTTGVIALLPSLAGLMFLLVELFG